MYATSQIKQQLIALSLAGCISTACFAGEKELVELLEKAAVQFERLNSTASAYSDILERVTDAQSADAVADQIEPAATSFVNEINTTTSIIESGIKESRTNQIRSPEYQSRAEAVTQKQPALVQEWLKQTSRYAKEANRVKRIKDLSPRFREVYTVQLRKVSVAGDRLRKVLGQTKALAQTEQRGTSKDGATTVADLGPDWPELDAPEAIPGAGMEVKFLTRADIIRKYGRDKVVFLEIVNAQEMPGDRHVARAIHAKGVEFARYRSGHAMAAPVDDIASFSNTLDLGQIMERDDAQRIVKLKADRSKVISSAGVVWIEIVNAGDLRGGSIPKDRLKRARTPAAKMQVLRESRRGAMPNFMSLVRLTAGNPKGWSFQGKENGKAEVGPIMNFDKFCSDLDFAEIVERDDSQRVLKLRVDASRLTNEAVQKKSGGSPRPGRRN
jgi:hypothetical protein